MTIASAQKIVRKSCMNPLRFDPMINRVWYNTGIMHNIPLHSVYHTRSIYTGIFKTRITKCFFFFFIIVVFLYRYSKYYYSSARERFMCLLRYRYNGIRYCILSYHLQIFPEKKKKKNFLHNALFRGFADWRKIIKK